MTPGRRRSGAAAGVVVAALVPAVLAAGCGVPTRTEVRVDGPGPQTDRLTAREEAGPPGPDEARDEEDLVRRFLHAAAGQPATAPERVVEFIHPDDREGWEPGSNVTVVQQEGAPETDRNGRVEVRAHQVGVLTEGGYIEPPATDELLTYTFQVVDEADTEGGLPGRDFVRRLYIRDPPQVILMEEEALRSYYLSTPVYFWDSADGDSLVPDLRWLPRTLPAEQRPDQLARWLVAGPSPWLASEVAALPDGTELRDRVVPAADRVRVNLTAAAADADLVRLGIQVQWTLRAATSGAQIELSVAEQLEVIDSTYRHANRAAAPKPPRYAVVDGAVRQLRGDPVQRIPALAEDANAGVETAAVTRDGEAAAVVRPEADGRLRLTVHTAGSGSPVSRVAATMSRPVWLDPAARIGLVVADGQLLRFTPDQITELSVPSLDGTLSGVAAAADGRRLALIAGGRLYVVPVRRDGGAVTAPPRVLPTTGRQITHVGFASELGLVYADTGEDRVTLYQITVDGAIESYEVELPTLGLTHLVALPTSPWDQSGGLIMYEVDGQSSMRQLRDPLQGGEPPIEQITLDAVLDLPEDAAAAPRAPFFLE